MFVYLHLKLDMLLLCLCFGSKAEEIEIREEHVNEEKREYLSGRTEVDNKLHKTRVISYYY